MKGYKCFNIDWTCRGFQYQIGESYEIEDKPICCQKGFHFCTNLIDCFSYYPFCEETKVAEIEAYGEISEAKNKDSKKCTNKIKIIKELNKEEIYNKINESFQNGMTIQKWFDLGKKAKKEADSIKNYFYEGLYGNLFYWQIHTSNSYDGLYISVKLMTSGLLQFTFRDWTNEIAWSIETDDVRDIFNHQYFFEMFDEKSRVWFTERIKNIFI